MVVPGSMPNIIRSVVKFFVLLYKLFFVATETKITKIYSFLIKSVIIIVALCFIYFELLNKYQIADIFKQSIVFFHKKYFLLFLLSAFLLMFLNWGIEALKWQFLIRKVEKISFLKSYKAILSGVTISIYTPNRVGEFAGRIFVLEKANRIEASLITIIGSFSQLFITILIGSFSFVYTYFNSSIINLSEYNTYLNPIFFALLILITGLFYFNISIFEKIINQFQFLKRLSKYKKAFSYYSSIELSFILFLSFIRYFVFALQFYLMLHAFDVINNFIDGILIISMIYFVMAVIPTFALTEIGIRCSVALFFVGLYYSNNLNGNLATDSGTIMATTFLWIINLALPALIGVFCIYQLKFFRKKESSNEL